ncbi:hypothetical protein GBO22_10705, partial [Mycobacterium avium subsp. hominissuis]|nr:hypothetical protein [Mycobacterium avium subsp. hominissuis]
TRWPSYVRDRHAAITYTTPRDAPGSQPRNGRQVDAVQPNERPGVCPSEALIAVHEATVARQRVQQRSHLVVQRRVGVITERAHAMLPPATMPSRSNRRSRETAGAAHPAGPSRT